jgi:hypothetical protein
MFYYICIYTHSAGSYFRVVSPVAQVSLKTRDPTHTVDLRSVNRKHGNEGAPRCVCVCARAREKLFSLSQDTIHSSSSLDAVLYLAPSYVSIRMPTHADACRRMLTYANVC